MEEEQRKPGCNWKHAEASEDALLLSIGNDLSASWEPLGNGVEGELEIPSTDPMAALCDVQEKDELSSIVEFLDRLNNNLEQEDSNIARSLESTATVKEDVKKLFEKATREESNQDLQEEDEVMNLREALHSEHQAIKTLNFELEEERKAAAIAATETMAMISRLQKEKAALQMEARQYQLMVEEKACYDQEVITVMKDILLEKVEEKHALEKELGLCKQRLFSEGARNWIREGSRSSPGHAIGREMDMLLLQGNETDISVDERGKGMLLREGMETDSSFNEMLLLERTTNNSSSNERGKGMLWPEAMEVDSSFNEMGMEMLLLEARMETDSSLSDDAIIDQFGHSMMNQSSSFASTPTIPFDDQAGAKEGYTWTDWEFLTSENLQNGELPQITNGTLSLQRPMDTAESNKVHQRHYSEKECGDDEHETVKRSQISSRSIIPEMSGVEPEAEMIAYKTGRIASNTFPKSVKQNNVVSKTGMPLSRAADDKVWGVMDPDFKIRRIGSKDGSSWPWDGEDLWSTSVHDVYEVKNESSENPSEDHPTKSESIAERNDWDFLERYGKVWQSKPFTLHSEVSLENGASQISGTSSQELVSGLGQRILNSFEMTRIDNDTPRNMVGDRLGKPDSSFPQHILREDKRGVGEPNGRKAALLSDTKKVLLPTDESTQNNVDYVHLHTFNHSLPKDSVGEEGSSSMVLQENSRTAIDDRIEQLTFRLHSLEAERESLKQTIVSLKRGNVSLKKGSGEMQMLQDISHQLRQIKSTESEVRSVRRLSLSSLFQGILSFNLWRRCVLSQLGRLVCWFLRAANAGASFTVPVGLTYILANKDKLQATSCVTLAFKPESVPPAWQQDHYIHSLLRAENLSDWRTDASGLSETALNGWNF
ncbi:hypothetical protein O6H91_01G110200 [Diphasiastrum complanatum]|uniref:Uncharacterized protein n=2 Tax=Diphasiastrum complanatum TaxID=34168 RepID=A0ACC2EUV9_DIPCM|nr:hypothetical protein O6H91_01G110200 [Diphasiastrum complanatum]KAJ7570203.1 hypothetical protein O6H91_01G110200 [Diphasiastrum complanatum]